MRGWILVLALLALAPALARAQASAPPAAVQSPQGAQIEQDKAALQDALKAFQSRGFAGLGEHLAALEAALDRAPADSALVRERPTEIVFRGDTLDQYLGFTVWIQARRKAAGLPAKPVMWEPSPYPSAALLLGSYYNEMKQPERALAYLQRGLALSPTDSRLTSETGMAYVGLHRFEDALKLYARLLGDPDVYLPPLDRARLLRAKGFSLTELGRLDEAEQAYRDSLKLEPDHQGAKNELVYIARLKAGAPREGTALTTQDKARKGE